MLSGKWFHPARMANHWSVSFINFGRWEEAFHLSLAPCYGNYVLDAGSRGQWIEDWSKEWTGQIYY